MPSPSKALVDPTNGASLIITSSIQAPPVQGPTKPSVSIQPYGLNGLATVIPFHSGNRVPTNVATQRAIPITMQRLGTFPPIYKENPATGGGGSGTGPTQGQMYPRIADPTYG